MRKLVFILFFSLFLFGCAVDYPEIDRYARIPSDLVKQIPKNDEYPPVLHSDEFEEPVPLAVISTAGAEDSPFIPVDRKEMYFVFVKDVREPVEVQVRDPVNGIWRSVYDNGWQEPELVWLQDADELALNGCTFVAGDLMVFCSAREGYTGLHWFRAARDEEAKSGWKFIEKVDFPEGVEVGELHIWDEELYYGSYDEGGKGDQDVWMMTHENGVWVNPTNIAAVNSPDNDGYPYVTANGQELWINRFYQGSPSVWRSKKVNGEWQEAELIVSSFAGEPTLDWEGNLYFVHHFYKGGVMLEADIYVAYRK